MSYQCTACTSAAIFTCDHTCALCDVEGGHESPACPEKLKLRASVLSFACPTCNAPAGTPCVDHAARTHLERTVAGYNALSKAETAKGEAAIEELRQIKSYLGHYDQDANHAWMVRRIDAVLAGRDPSGVVGWTEHDGTRPHPTTCPDCGQPLLPPGTVKKPNEYDHASGCPQEWVNATHAALLERHAELVKKNAELGAKLDELKAKGPLSIERDAAKSWARNDADNDQRRHDIVSARNILKPFKGHKELGRVALYVAQAIDAARREGMPSDKAAREDALLHAHGEGQMNTLDHFCEALGWSRVPVQDALAEVKRMRALKLNATELETLEDVFDRYVEDDHINAHLTDAARRLYKKLTAE